MALSPFMAAVNQIAEEKDLEKEIVLETVEQAIAAAYRKDYGNPKQIVKAKINPETDEFDVFRVFEVVKEVEDEESQKTLKEAKKIKKNAKVGEEVEIPLQKHEEFGRIAAQTAKQVITQRLREAERNVLLLEFQEKEHKVIPATIQQIEGRNVIVDLGKANGYLPALEQIPGENYRVGQRLKIYVVEVSETNKGPKILVSRSKTDLISGLLEAEVPEIAAKTVEIKSIAREPGARTKVAVSSNQEGLDPVGSCVGQRGMRISAVLSELPGEKIDIVLYDEKLEKFVENSLSPAKIETIKIDKKNKKAQVLVLPDQLSLAIGKGGQNVRLASKITGLELDIVKLETKKSNEGNTTAPDTIVTTDKLEKMVRPLDPSTSSGSPRVESRGDKARGKQSSSQKEKKNA